MPATSTSRRVRRFGRRTAGVRFSTPDASSLAGGLSDGDDILAQTGHALPGDAGINAAWWAMTDT
jgi:hypothetical protein